MRGDCFFLRWFGHYSLRGLGSLQDWKDCIAVEYVKVSDHVVLDGSEPPSVCEVMGLEVAPVRVEAFFSKDCDVHQLHVYGTVQWLLSSRC